MEIGDLKSELAKAFREIEAGVDRSEAKKRVNDYLIETKLKREKENRMWLEQREKERIQHEKESKAALRKYRAEKKKEVLKIKAFKISMLKKGNRGFGDPWFVSDQPFAEITSQVTYKNLFSLSGDFLFRAEDIEYGKDGLLYAVDRYYSMYKLMHYDSISEKLEHLFLFDSLKELKFKLYELDPEGMLGFSIKMYDHEKEEYRVSKLTPDELLAEEQEKERIREENRKASRSSSKSVDDEFDKLFM